MGYRLVARSILSMWEFPVRRSSVVQVRTSRTWYMSWQNILFSSKFSASCPLKFRYSNGTVVNTTVTSGDDLCEDTADQMMRLTNGEVFLGIDCGRQLEDYNVNW